MLEQIKAHIYPEGKYVPQRILAQSFAKKFPEIYATLSTDGNFIENLYLYTFLLLIYTKQLKNKPYYL